MTKRTVAEWITVAKVSRNVGHIFFEGATDARIIAHASGYPSSIDFRSADEVEEEDGQASNSILSGNKMRLVVLAENSAINNCDNIRCLIDSDFAVFISHLRRNNCLFETEYANLPVSTLTFRWLQGFILKGYGATIDESIWSFFSLVLKFAFVARFMSSSLEVPKAAPCISDYVVIKRDFIEFDDIKYLKSYFNPSHSEIQSLKNRIDETVEWLQGDIRNVINSNDLFELIYGFLKKKGRISGSTPRDAIKQAYLSAIDDDIFEQNGFNPMRDWMRDYNCD